MFLKMNKIVLELLMAKIRIYATVEHKDDMCKIDALFIS